MWLRRLMETGDTTQIWLQGLRQAVLGHDGYLVQKSQDVVQENA